MKTPLNRTSICRGDFGRIALALAIISLPIFSVRASQAYGSVNNFDVVNDTSNLCHGFEIELDDLQSTEITYTYDYNHYGVPKITEQSSLDGSGVWHTNVFVDYEGIWTNTGWSAHTAVPASNIPPTMGHQFTNPNINFGGEHFGAGYTRNPSKILYFWMADNGSHTLNRSGQVYVSTPTFTYNPPAIGVQPAAAQAVIPAPILPMSYICPNPEFSDAVWCKVITTTTQTNTPVSVNDLMTPDTDNPSARDWRNGQTNVQVETEWQLLQIDYLSSDYSPTNGLGGANSKLAGANRSLSSGDDVVTYRYEYYAYAGPYADWDTHEAMCQMPGSDGIHGTGTYVDGSGTTIDLTSVVVVGKFLGAQMSAMDAAPPVGLVDHVPDGEDGVAYPPRTVIIAGDTNFVTSYTGALPAGMAFDTNRAVLYGTPYSSGVFIFTVTAASSNNPPVSKTYPFLISLGGGAPPHSAVDTAASPADGGITSGDNVYTNGTIATVSATARHGFGFGRWTENGLVVSTSSDYSFTNIVNRSLVANFVPQLTATAQSGQLIISWLTNFNGYTLQQCNDLRLGNWVNASNAVTVSGDSYQAAIDTTNSGSFFRIYHQ